MNRKLLVTSCMALCGFMGIFAIFPVNVTTLRGEEIPDSSGSINEKLDIEKRNLEKLRTQLQILEIKEDEEKEIQNSEPRNVEQESSKKLRKVPIVINPNENIVLTKEIGEYGVAVYSIDATQVKVADILQALSASFGKSIIVDEDVDSAYLSSFLNISWYSSSERCGANGATRRVKLYISSFEIFSSMASNLLAYFSNNIAKSLLNFSKSISS